MVANDSVFLYVEGKGTNSRQAFSRFFENAGFSLRKPKVFTSGSRRKAIEDFDTACKNGQKAYLLIDSEAGVGDEFTGKPWKYLVASQICKSAEIGQDEQCHLMVECMENWFLADPKTLNTFFGSSFKENALPPSSNSIERISKQAAQEVLKKATKDCKKQYQKGNVSFDLLEKIDPNKIVEKSPWAKRFIDTLKTALTLAITTGLLASGLLYEPAIAAKVMLKVDPVHELGKAASKIGQAAHSMGHNEHSGQAAASDSSKSTTQSSVYKTALTSAERKQILAESWAHYKATFIQKDGRVIDYNGNVSTSEGQSYAMLRAFWMRDRETFDKCWAWAKNNLQVPRGDHLFSWKWGEKPDGTWGALDQTSATDADQDIAFSLILANHVWQDPTYLDEAKPILNAIWDRLTLNMPIGRVLLPGDWPKKGNSISINPSYFAPYAYRAFAEADPDHDWTNLSDSSYEILTRAIAQTTTHFPPDWVNLSLDNDQVSLYTKAADARSDFGYDAIRTYWRIGLDALLMPLEQRTAPILAAHTMLPRYWIIRKDVPISVTWDGIVRHPNLESGAVYGTILPALYRQEDQNGRATAQEIVTRRIIPNLKPGGQWNTKNDYYAQNWLWMGLALDSLLSDPPDFSRATVISRLAKMLQP